MVNLKAFTWNYKFSRVPAVESEAEANRQRIHKTFQSTNSFNYQPLHNQRSANVIKRKIDIERSFNKKPCKWCKNYFYNTTGCSLKEVYIEKNRLKRKKIDVKIMKNQQTGSEQCSLNTNCTTLELKGAAAKRMDQHQNRQHTMIFIIISIVNTQFK